MNEFNVTRRALIVSAGAGIASLAAPPGIAFAEAIYPAKPIRLVVAFPPGGSTTIVARLFGQKLTERLGQPVIVDSRPGANGVIASEELLKSPADGYTLLMVVNTHSINPLVMEKLPYDTSKDFAPISTLYKLELILVANPSVPASNLKEFIALAKSKPGEINFAAGDTAGLTHLAAETFNNTVGIKAQVIPYTGTGPALNDTLGGHVQAYFSSATPVIPQIKAGKLKAFGISGKVRSSILPDVPTFAEQGLTDFDAGTWGGLLAPAATPRPVVEKLASEIAAIMNLQDVKEQLLNLGLVPMTTSPNEFAALIKSDTARFDKIIKTAHIKLDR